VAKNSTAKNVAIAVACVGVAMALFITVGLMLASKNQNGNVRDALESQGYDVVNTDSFGGTAIVRGPGGCEAPIVVTWVDDDLIALQKLKTVEPSTVECS